MKTYDKSGEIIYEQVCLEDLEIGHVVTVDKWTHGAAPEICFGEDGLKPKIVNRFYDGSGMKITPIDSDGKETIVIMPMYRKTIWQKIIGWLRK